MNWQDVFYAVGSVALLLSLFMMVGILVMTFMVYRKASRMYKSIRGTIIDEASGIAFQFGEAMGSTVGKSIHKIFGLFRNTDEEDVTYISS